MLHLRVCFKIYQDKFDNIQHAVVRCHSSLKEKRKYVINFTVLEINFLENAKSRTTKFSGIFVREITCFSVHV